MSLTLTALGVYLASRGGNSMENYILGCDVMGASDVEADAKANGTEVHVHAGTYWTSVAAGLTVAAAWTLMTGAAAIGGRR